jgi:protein Mpv17
MGMMEGRPLNQIATKFSDLFVPTLIANWQVWPVIQVSNLTGSVGEQ